MRGKYSPTVTVAYMRDQEWHCKYVASGDSTSGRDPGGYDSYGYDDKDVDRAGNNESDYYMNDAPNYYDNVLDYNIAYDLARDAWGFDGVKPVEY
jgi:hypothetical protein